MDDQQIIVLDPTGSDRHGEDAALRARGPAARVDVLGVPAWAVTDPALLKQLLTDSRISKDPHQHWPLFPDQIVGKWPLALWVAVRNMFTAYGADHRRLRRLVSPAFTARRVQALSARIEEVTHGLLDDLAATPPGEPADLRARFAYPLPIQVIGHLMGLPEDAIGDFRGAVDAVFATTLTPEEATANTEKLYGLLAGLVAAKRAAPAADLTSTLIASRDVEGDGSRLSEQELLDTLLLVISAGYETTVNLLDQAVTALLSHPDQLAAVRDGRAEWSTVVEEALRWEAPVPHLPMRFATEDIALPTGETIKAGDAILASYSAAGRHPALHGPTAEEFDLSRPSSEHLAFGHGVHFCLGAPLARMEAEIALRGLFTRFPDLALAVPPHELRPQGSFLANGHKEVPALLGRDARS
ncbi:cytochrome P450 [Streptomyces sp. NPDC047117]|uniref:cytochrome P450 family protein n=1 Tax=Streptomyces sp. NPDC047117 TaxID=3155379 RepID=UPI0033C8DFEB